MKLKELRVLNNLTQDELSQRVGITRFTYSNYENGKTQPDFDILIKIADLYNVSLDYLLGRQFGNYVDKATLTENQKKLLEFSMAYDDEMNEDFLNVLYGYVSRIEPKTQPIYKNKETI